MYDIRRVIQKEIEVHPLEYLLIQPRRFLRGLEQTTWTWANITAVFGCDMSMSWLWIENANHILKTLAYHGRLLDFGISEIEFRDFDRVVRENADIPIEGAMMHQIHRTYLDYRRRPLERFVLNPKDVAWAFRELANNAIYPKRKVFYKNHFTLAQCLSRHLAMTILDYSHKPAEKIVTSIIDSAKDLRLQHHAHFKAYPWDTPMCAFKTPKGYLTY